MEYNLYVANLGLSLSYHHVSFCRPRLLESACLSLVHFPSKTRCLNFFYNLVNIHMICSEIHIHLQNKIKNKFLYFNKNLWSGILSMRYIWY